MQDEPSKERLLADVAAFLMGEVLPALNDPGLSFRVRVAAHLLGTVAREAHTEEALDATELAGLVELGLAEPAVGQQPTREAIVRGNAALAERIRDKGADPASDAQLVRSLRTRLSVSNPRFSTELETGEDEWTL